MQSARVLDLPVDLPVKKRLPPYGRFRFCGGISTGPGPSQTLHTQSAQSLLGCQDRQLATPRPCMLVQVGMETHT